MWRDNRGSGGGGVSIGFLGLLAITFIVLKLVGVITWSWVWVLAPLWIMPVILVLVIVIFHIIF